MHARNTFVFTACDNFQQVLCLSILYQSLQAINHRKFRHGQGLPLQLRPAAEIDPVDLELDF